MAQAGDELDNVEDGRAEGHGSGACDQHTTCHGSGAPTMPHTDLTREELEERHPSLLAPEDEQLDDLNNDLQDAVYQKGLALADEIRDATSLQGRVRRPLLLIEGLEEQPQQQKDLKRTTVRARTSRPLGGGVISGASPTTLTATVPTTVPTTTDGQTTVGAEVGAAEVDGGRECGKSGREGKAMEAVSKVVQMDRSDEHASSCSVRIPSLVRLKSALRYRFRGLLI